MANNVLNELLTAGQYLGTQDYNNYCEAFVEKVTGGGQYPSAYQAYLDQSQQGKVNPGGQGLTPGDKLYFSPNAGNGGYGHTGIYLGNGNMISATDSGVRISNIAQWMQGTGQQLLGFVGGLGKDTINTLKDVAPQFQQAIQVTKALQPTNRMQLTTNPIQPQGQQPQQIPLQPQPQGNQPQGQQPQSPPSGKIQMPQVQNPAGQSAPFPLGSMMSNMSGGAQGPGQSQGGRSPMIAGTMARGGYSPTNRSQPATMPRAAGTGSSQLTNNAAYQNYLNYVASQQQNQQSIANAQASLLASQNTTPDMSNLAAPVPSAAIPTLPSVVPLTQQTSLS